MTVTKAEFARLVAVRIQAGLYGTVDPDTRWVNAPLSDVLTAVFRTIQEKGTPDRPAEACPRCGAYDDLGEYAVCAPCAAAMGWDPPCPACDIEGRGEKTAVPHVDTCDGVRRIEQLIEASSLGTPDAKAMIARTPGHVARAVVERSKQIAEEEGR